MTKKSWTITVEEDPETGDLILPFPEDFLLQQGWVEGDTIDWTDAKDGTWIINKAKDA